MTVITEPIGLAEGRPFTVRNLEAMPDDGRRYELIDGMLLVTPVPGWPHQEMALTLYMVLRTGRYQLTAKVSGEEISLASRPFPVRVCPARLLDGLRPH
ncbi:MAG: hypothetical protein ACRDTG_03295 [Pseudonocardiaceae bacterium]